MFRTISSVAMIAASLFAANQAGATVAVYSQSPNGIYSYPDTSAVYNSPYDPGFNWTLDGDAQVWADFTVATDLSFNRIAWYGSNADGNFAVDFYNSAPACATPHSACGTLGVSGGGKFSNNLLPVSGPFSQAEVHKTQISQNLYSYYIDLPTLVTLDHTKLQWLSVVNNYSSAPFSWSHSANGIGSHAYFINGLSKVLTVSGNLAFELSNTSVAAVPLPASVWLFGSAFVGWYCGGRRNKAVRS